MAAISANTISENTILEEDTQSEKYLTFKLENEHYGIAIEYVTEIINMLTITQIPGLPDYIKGIINLRGKIVPVMDLRLKFNMNVIEYDDRTCIIVAMIDNMDIGFIVDSISEVLIIPDEDIVPPSEMSKESKKFINGISKVGGDIKLLLDCHKLLCWDD